MTWVKVVGAAGDRYALVCFKKPEDVEKALEVSHDKLFFGCKIEVAPYQGYDVEDNEFRPYEAEVDEYHPKATRTLFIGNLEKDVTASELRKHFEPFGEIIVSRDSRRSKVVERALFFEIKNGGDSCSVLSVSHSQSLEHSTRECIILRSSKIRIDASLFLSSKDRRNEKDLIFQRIF